LAPVFSALLMLVTAPAVHAQQASQPAYDPRQFDQRFNGEQRADPGRATPPADGKAGAAGNASG
jgi:hypothetical protein